MLTIEARRGLVAAAGGVSTVPSVAVCVSGGVKRKREFKVCGRERERDGGEE